MEGKKKKKYKIVNGKKVEDHSGLGLKKFGKFGKSLLKIISRTDGFNTYSKEDLKKIKENSKNNKNKNPLNKYNPLNKENKKIREKEKTIKSDKSTRKEKAVAKVQKAAYVRKRDDKTIADVKAANKKKMRDAARTRNEKFKKTGKSTIEQRRAAAKERMRKAAKERHEAFKNKRSLKIANKKKKKR